MHKRFFALFIAIFCSFSFIHAEGKDNPEVIFTTVESVNSISDFGDIILNISTSDIINAGYDYADIVNISINGETAALPLIAGFKQMETGCASLVAAASGVVTLSMLLCLFAEQFDIADYYEKEDGNIEWIPCSSNVFPIKIEISLKEKQGYAAMYKIYNLPVRTTFDPDTETEEEFANFRNITTTGIKPGILYRGASPVDNKYGRIKICNSLLKKYGIKTVINLANSYADAQEFEGFDESYYKTLDVSYRKITTLDIQKIGETLSKAFRKIIYGNPPFYFHCQEGIDRTGIFAALLEGLCGASDKELLDDNMLTYKNYYNVVPGTPEYEQLCGHLQRMIQLLGQEHPEADGDLRILSVHILKDVGLSNAEIDALKHKLAGTD